MIKHKEVVEERRIEVVEDVICDKCGKSCLRDNPDDFASFEYAILGEHWGFLGGDFDREHHLYRECTDEIISTFKHQGERESWDT